jgi:hypothetical protein
MSLSKALDLVAMLFIVFCTFVATQLCCAMLEGWAMYFSSALTVLWRSDVSIVLGMIGFVVWDLAYVRETGKGFDARCSFLAGSIYATASGVAWEGALLFWDHWSLKYPLLLAFGSYHLIASWTFGIYFARGLKMMR